MRTRWNDSDIGARWWRRWRRACEQKQHAGTIEKSSGREMASLAGPLIRKRMVCPLRVACRPRRQGWTMSTPWSQKPVSAAVMLISAGPMTSKLTVIGRGLSNVDALAVDGDGEKVRAHLFRDGRGLKASGGMKRGRDGGEAKVTKSRCGNARKATGRTPIPDQCSAGDRCAARLPGPIEAANCNGQSIIRIMNVRSGTSSHSFYCVESASTLRPAEMNPRAGATRFCAG